MKRFFERNQPFLVFRKLLQVKRIKVFLAFWSPTVHDLGIVFCVSSLFSYVPALQYSSKIRKETTELLVKVFFLMGAAAMVLSTGLARKLVLLAGKLRVHEFTSSVVSGCLRLLSGAPDALEHPRKEHESISRSVVVRRCRYPQVKCKLPGTS